MDIFEVIHQHRSIRKYKPDPIPDEILEKIIEAGIRASSSGNMQTWSLVITQKKELREQLFKPHFEQEMVLEAPALFTFCSDFHRMRLWLKESDAPVHFDNLMSFMIGAIDAVLVAQNMALAAEAEGLGICYMGTTLASCYEIAEILELPPNVVPVAGYVIGYPDENPIKRDRLERRGLVHYEKYQDYTPESIHEIYKDRETKGWKRYMDVPELKARVEQAGVKNLAQIYSIVKYTEESHKHFSQNIIKCLQRQNFYNND